MSPPPPSSPPSNLPSLSTHPTTSLSTQTSALKLIADSIAQQRQLAARALLTHPLCLSVFALLFASFFSLFAWGVNDDSVKIYDVNIDKTMLFTTAGGVVMLGLVGVRAFTGVYLVRAEKIGWGWLNEGLKKGEVGTGKRERERGEEHGEGGKDELEVEVVVVVTVWDERVIATVVMNVDRSRRKALVRAWTTMLKYRGAGVGRGVLEEAVKVAVRGYGCKEMEFGEDHANSKHILPSLFNYPFLRREARARRLLAEIVRGELRQEGQADGSVDM